MKKIMLVMSILILSLSFTGLTATELVRESDQPAAAEYVAESSEKDANLLELRVKEIREMDRSELSDEERAELREELRDIKAELSRPGIYIGSGVLLVAIILILLLR
jgi:DNA gyrase/topoisomerase IV subunit A